MYLPNEEERKRLDERDFYGVGAFWTSGPLTDLRTQRRLIWRPWTTPQLAEKGKLDTDWRTPKSYASKDLAAGTWYSLTCFCEDFGC
jgi:hypothetical protein